MNKLMATVCFMLAASPLAFAQDKAQDDAKKTAPAAVTSPAAAPAKAEAPKAGASKADANKADAPKADKARKERTAAQKARDAHEKECNAQAGEKKGDERKKLMGSCMKAQKKADDDRHKAQRERQRTCDKLAKDKKVKSEDRKVFMQDCLSTKK